MNTTNENSVRMALAVQKVLKDGETIWKDAKAFSNTVAVFRHLMDDLKESQKDAQEDSKGATDDKAIAEERAIKLAVNLAKRASVYALNIENMDLFQQLNINKSPLADLHDNVLVAKLNSILETLEGIAGQLSDYDVKPEHLKKLDELIKAFEGMEAKLKTTEIFKNISEKADKASQDLARIYGEPELLKGYGRRNTTTMAIAPTTSSSAILGQTSPGIEPFSSNYYKAGLSKGNFMRKNKYLKKLLEEKGLDNEEVWREIMLNGGSVQHMSQLSAHEKDVFKTFKEISQLEIVQQAAIRQKFVDQGQSLNLNIPAELAIKEVNRLIIEAWQLGIKSLYYQRSQSVSKELVTSLVSCSSCES